MWITNDVDLPGEVVDALQSDRLVVFVGAGASVAAPSSLPPFKQLAIDLGRRARVEYHHEPIDRFLGELDGLIDVHNQVHELIARPDSRPNALHQAIVRLTTSRPESRIVTTNFDDHLRCAAKDMGVDLGSTYFAPALPLGAEFRGLVHLHGAVTQPPSNLVVTDRDFGRAYLTQGWATRFLRDLFVKYTVLFVGYSHTDPTVEYLSLGLPSRTHRFALSADEDLGPWTRRGITPIHYPPGDGHAGLLHAVQEWSDREHMGLLDHRARLRSLVSELPPKSPAEVDYVRARLETPDGANTFENTAKGTPWLEWLSDHAGFRALFGAEPIAASTPALERWFSAQFLDTTDGQAAALETIRRFGQRMNPELLRSASWSVRHLADAGDVRSACRLTALLLTSVNGGTSTAGLFTNLGARDDELGLQVLRELLRPRLELRKNVVAEIAGTGPGLPLADLAWPGSAYQVRALVAALRKSGTLSDREGFRLFEATLRAASTLMQDFHGPDSFDSLTFRRSAIEPHAQDIRNAIEDVVVDGLRDLAVAAPPAPDVLDGWIDGEVSLLRRIAVHVVNVADSRAPAEKIDWAIRHELLFDHVTKHEAYLLLRAHISHASVRSKTQILKRIRDVLSDGEGLETDERNLAYRRFNLAAWLADAEPTWRAITRVKTKTQEKYGFEVREHPDLDHFVTSGAWEERAPVTEDELRKDLEKRTPARVLADLVGREYSELDFNSPSWNGVLRLVSSIAIKDHDLGISLFEGAETLAKSDRIVSVMLAIAEAWATSDESYEATPVLECLLRHQPELIRPTASLIQHRARNTVDATVHDLEALRAAADQIWTEHHAAFRHSDEAEASLLALNSWPGDLARFWINDISRRWRDAGASWAGINTALATRLTEMLESGDPSSHAVTAALSADLYFLFSADSAFVSEHLLPRFEAAKWRRWTWSAYLFNRRWDNALLGSGLYGAALASVATVPELLPTRVESEFPMLFASILAFADLSQCEQDAIVDAFVIESGTSHLLSFIECIGQVLQEYWNEADAIWDRSIGKQMRRRFNGLPRKAAPEELAAWADLMPLLDRNLQGEIEVLRTTFVPLNDRLTLPDTSDLSRERAQLILEYLTLRIPSPPSTVGAGSLWSISDFALSIGPRIGKESLEPLQVALAAVGQNLRSL